jgi:hypothetical protein
MILLKPLQLIRKKTNKIAGENFIKAGKVKQFKQIFRKYCKGKKLSPLRFL